MTEGLSAATCRSGCTARSYAAASRLTRIREGKDETWLLIKRKDAEADARRKPVKSQPESVLSGRTLDDLGHDRSRRSSRLVAHAARRAGARLASTHPGHPDRQRFSDPQWIFERKFDGMRCLAFRDGDRVRLLSRNRQPLNGTYPELVDALAAQHTSRFVVDGEVVAFEGRRTSFARLQGRLGITDPEVARASQIRIFYYLFDLLHLDGKSTIDIPLHWRKRLLRSAIELRRSAA